MPRIADVANTWPLDPSVRTTIEATTTIRSARDGCEKVDRVRRRTDDANWLADEPEPAPEAHVFGPAARRPQPHQVLHTEEDHQTNLLQQSRVNKAPVCGVRRQ
jgi:hypothetical protein